MMKIISRLAYFQKFWLSGMILLIPLTAISQRPKIGLALSGGGARGFAHIGVLKVLDSLNIPVDYIAGTSMGSIAGGLYAIGYTSRQLDSLANFIDWNIIFTDKPRRSKRTYLEKWDMDRFQVALLLSDNRIHEPSGLIFGQKVSMLLSRLTTPLYSDVDFDRLPIPFRCVATDLVTGTEVVLKSGSLARAIRASMSVPSIFAPVPWGDSLLVDGGVLNNVPVDVVREMGAEFIIAVNVGTPLKSREELTGAVSILMQSFALAGNQKQVDNLAQADLVLTPDLYGYSNTDFDNHKIREMIAKGAEAARRQLFRPGLLAAQPLPETYTSPAPQPQEGLIHGVIIQGYKELPFAFIYQILGLRPGEPFTRNLLDDRIEHLYSLGYFKNIEYHLIHHQENRYRLYIQVRENTDGLARMGFRYQDDKKIILGLNLKLRDFPAPGILSDMSYLFSGLQIWEWELSYPRRMFGSRFYPYLYGFYTDIPVSIYFQRELIARYKNRGYGGAGGVGFIMSNWGVIKTDYFYEQLDINSEITPVGEIVWPVWNYPVHLGRIFADIDLLDDPLTPLHGYKLQAGFEKTLDFMTQHDAYQRVYLEQRFYGTPFRHNTTSLYLFFGFSKNSEIYRHFYLGGPATFVGYQYDEYAGPNMGIYRIDSQFHLNDILSLLLTYNMGNIWDDYKNIDFRLNRTSGFGMGVQLKTFFGPFQYRWGHSGSKDLHYFTLGFSLATRQDERK